MLVADPGPPKRDTIHWQVLIGVVVGILVGLVWPHLGTELETPWRMSSSRSCGCS